MRKRSFMVIAALMLIGVAAFFAGCASNPDPYYNMSVKSNKSAISLELDFNSDGSLDYSRSKTYDNFTVSVSNAPGMVSNAASASSLDTSVATCEVMSTSKGSTVIKVTAVNGGQTQIKVMAGGGGSSTETRGGKYALVDVTVDIPPTAMTVKSNTYFGVERGGSIVLDENSYNFYSNASKISGYEPTLKTVSYEFAPNFASQALQYGCTVNGSVLTVSANYPMDTIQLIPTIVASGAVGDPITVYVLNPISLANFTVLGAKAANTTASKLPTVELVKNVSGSDLLQSAINFQSSDPLYNKLGTDWGYSIAPYDNSIVFIDDNGLGTPNFISTGIGETTVSISVYPIKVIDGVSVAFTNSVLTKTAKIKVEVRNVFKAGQIVFTYVNPATARTEIMPSPLSTFFSLDNAPFPTEFTLGVLDEQGKLSNLTINNTSEEPTNNYVTFDVGGIGAGMTQMAIYDAVDISYKVYPYTGKAVLMQKSDYTRGVPYNSIFTVTPKAVLKDTSQVNTDDAYLTVKSVGSGSNTAVDGVQINLDFVYQITSFNVVTNYNYDIATSTSSWVDVDKLCPVADGSGRVYFYLMADGKTDYDWYDFIFEGAAADLFEVNSGLNVVSDVKNDKITRFTLEIKPGAVPDPDTRYWMTVRHRSGISVKLGIQVLTRVTEKPSLSVSAAANGMVYDSFVNSMGDFTALVEVGGTYSFDVNARGAAGNINYVLAGSGFSVPNAPEGLQFDGNRFVPTVPGTYTFTGNFDVYNTDVFPNSSWGTITVELIVVNPIVSTSFSKNNVSVFSKSTLGLSSAFGLDQAQSRTDFYLQFAYASGAAADWASRADYKGYEYSISVTFSFAGMKKIDDGHYKSDLIDLWQDPDNPLHFTVQGLQSSVNPIDISFIVNQVFTKGTETYTVNFLSTMDKYHPNAGTDEGSHFFVTVNDAVTVQNIYVADATDSLNIMLYANAANTGVDPTALTLRASVYPQNVNNSRVGFGFLDGGEIVQAISDNGIPVISVNKTTGLVTAYASTISSRLDITLVVYAADSLNGDFGMPGTYIKIPVYIYDTSGTNNERVIRNLEEFLQAFYVKSSSSYTGTFTELAAAGRLVSRTDLGVTKGAVTYNCYYQLAADIDLSPVYVNANTYLPMVQHFGESGSAVFNGSKPTAAGMGECYSVINFKVPEQVGSVTGLSEEYRGFFDVINAHGTVQSVNFTNVSGKMTSAGNTSRTEQCVGVIAAVNKGTIKNVSVIIADSAPLSFVVGYNNNVGNKTTANIGGIAGRNEGEISETADGRLYVSGTIVVDFSVNLQAGYYTNVNFGGLVGLNTGKVYGKNSGIVLGGDGIANCDATLELVGDDRDLPVSPDNFVNAGGIAGWNAGASADINGLLTQCLVYNSAYTNANSGGVVGHNSGGAILQYCASNSAVYARNSVGGVAGRNTGVPASAQNNSRIEYCFYENYLNEKVKSKLITLLKDNVYVTYWGNGDAFYSGLILDGQRSNSTTDYYSDSANTIGGVVGVDDAGDVKYSFASSMFNNKVQNVDVFDLPYKGDIYVIGSRNAVVGGVIGRLEANSVADRNAQILGCYSTLTVYYDFENNVSSSGDTNDVTRIGGLIGVLNTVKAQVKYCYEDVDLNLVLSPLYGAVSFGGFVGGVEITGTEIIFDSCYVHNTLFSQPLPTMPLQTIVTNGQDSRVFAGPYAPMGTAITGMMSNCTNVASGAGINLDTKNWVDGVNGAPSKGIFAYDDVTQGIEYLYPVVMVNGSPYVIASPKTITLTLQDAETYKSIFGKVQNNRGGFNFVVPDEHGTSAALFYSGGNYTASDIAANRYYLSDIFAVSVDPAIAAKKISYSIQGAGTEAVVQGYTLDADGSPRYYIDVKKAGVTFNLVVTSDRFLIDESGVMTAAKTILKFNTVNSIGVNTALASLNGVIGRASMDGRSTIANGTFDVQTGVNFNLNAGVTMSGSAKVAGWNVRIKNTGAVSTQLIGGSGEFLNTGTLVFQGIGTADFEFMPTVTGADGTVYLCDALAVNVTANVCGGAVEVSFDQSTNSPNGTLGGSMIDTSVIASYDGTFATDLEPGNFGSVSTDGVTTQMLLSLTDFSIRINGLNYALFAQDKATGRYATSTVRSNIGGQNVDLLFQIKVNSYEPTANYHGLGSYTEYRFTISVSVVVDANGKLYGNINGPDAMNPVMAFAEDFEFSGQIFMVEKYIRTGYTPKIAVTNLDLVAADLKSVDIQHYANTQIDSNNALTMDETQPQSTDIYVQDGLQGLLKVYAMPYYATIKDFSFAMNEDAAPTLQLVGHTDTKSGSLPIYEQWDIVLVQKVWNGKQYVNFAGGANNLAGDGKYHFYQVSSVNSDGIYTWNGVYYIQTTIASTKTQYIWRGADGLGDKNGKMPASQADLENYSTKVNISEPTMRIQSGVFNLTAAFTTNNDRVITKSVKLYAIEKPGLYFQVDGQTVTQTEQAVGTYMGFSVRLVPADKTTILNTLDTLYPCSVRVDGVINESLAKVENFDTEANVGTVWISSQIDMNAKVELVFEYRQIESNGAVMEYKWDTNNAAILTITPVLFKVTGIYVPGVWGDTIRLAADNRQTMQLKAYVTYATEGPGINAAVTAAAIADFNKKLNNDYSEWITWTVNGQKLNTNWNSLTEFYKVPASGVNFYLGMYSGITNIANPGAVAGQKFILDSSSSAGASTLYIEMPLKYTNGIPALVESSPKTLAAAYNISTNTSSSAQPIQIWQDTAYQLLNMQSGYDYILMEDIDLSLIQGMENGWTPITFAARSLDGNNKKVTINKFNLGALPINIGLFSSIEQGSVVKNLNVALPNGNAALDINLVNYASLGEAAVNVGILVGQNNGGIITNCAVVSQKQFGYNADGYVTVNYDSSTYDKAFGKGQQAVITVNCPLLTVYYGGLAGRNNAFGVISNSRVMIDVVVGNYVPTGETNTNVLKNVVVAGFAAVNSGTIVSSFFRDGNILNYASGATVDFNNRTAGFVGYNAGANDNEMGDGLSDGIIKGCYAMGVADELNTNGTVKYGRIESYGGVGGFAYTNSGTIEDCYVNVRITMSSSASAFADTNIGTLTNCFVNNDKPGSMLSTYYAFIRNLETGSVVDNCTYVSMDKALPRGFNGTTIISNTDSLRELNSSLDYDNYIGDVENFSKPNGKGVAFSIGTYTDSDPVTIWQMVPKKINATENIYTPELVSANDIAVSIRMVENVKDLDGKTILSYSPYALGSRQNPIPITNAEEFNQLIYKGSQADALDQVQTGMLDYSANIYSGYIRLVNNISMAKMNADGTGGDLTTGDFMQTYKTVFGGTLDGNGLSINDIVTPGNVVDATSRGLEGVGLFSSVENATVKNLGLGIGTGLVSGSTVGIYAEAATYVGGLAGTSKNSNLADISITSSGSAEIVGKCLVGGLVGYAETSTDTVITGIKSGAAVTSEQNTTAILPTFAFDTGADYVNHGRTGGYKDVGIAGGIIGMVSGAGKITNIKNFDADSTMAVTGEVAGGLIGAVDVGVDISGAWYSTTKTSGVAALRGKYYIGGLVGVNLGKIHDSQVTLPSMNIQSAADNNGTAVIGNAANYIFYSGTGSEMKTNIHGMTVGGAVGFNTGSVDSVTVQVGMGATNFNYVLVVGGVVGENLDGSVMNCKLNNSTINGGYYIGGIVGMNYGDATTAVSGNTIRDDISWGENILFNPYSNAFVTIDPLAVNPPPFNVFGGGTDTKYKNLLVFFIPASSSILNYTTRYPDNVSGQNYYSARSLFTGAQIGVNFDTDIIFSGDTMNLDRVFGLYSVARTPQITSAPALKPTVHAGGTLTLGVSAASLDGGTISFAWYKNTVNSTTGGQLVNGQVSSSFSVPAGDLSVAGKTVYYYVVITNTVTIGTSTSTSSTSTVMLFTVSVVV